MKITAPTHSTECLAQGRCQPGRYADALRRDEGARLLAQRTECVEHRSVLNRFKAVLVKWFVSLAPAADIQVATPRRTQACRWLAGECPFDAKIYKQLIAEGGALNALYFALVDIKSNGGDVFSARATALLDQKIKGITALDWAAGGLFAGRQVRNKAIRNDLGGELKQWINTAQQFIAGADLRVIRCTKNLPWLGADNPPQRFRALLAALEAPVNWPEGDVKEEAGRLLLETFQGIEVKDWAAEQGVAKMWFTYASEVDKASNAKALDQWMASALRIIERAWEGGGTAVIRPTLKMTTNPDIARAR